MILYFSGTGNSKYVAKVLAKETNDQIISLNERIKNNDFSPINANNEIIIIFPNYCGRMPKIVYEYLNKIELKAQGIRFICTCFQSSWEASKYCNILAKKQKIKYLGMKEIKMPQGYVANYNILNQEEANKKVEETIPDIIEIAKIINSNLPFEEEKVSIKGKFMTNIMAPMFYSIMVSSKGFNCNDDCSSCGKCAKICPLNNIEIVNGKPQWKNNCTHCMACINSCPKKAINYKNKTQNRNRHIINIEYKN